MTAGRAGIHLVGAGTVDTKMHGAAFDAHGNIGRQPPNRCVLHRRAAVTDCYIRVAVIQVETGELCCHQLDAAPDDILLDQAVCEAALAIDRDLHVPGSHSLSVLGRGIKVHCRRHRIGGQKCEDQKS